VGTRVEGCQGMWSNHGRGLLMTAVDEQAHGPIAIIV